MVKEIDVLMAVPLMRDEATLWRIEHTTTIHGEPHVHYISVDVADEAPLGTRA